MDTRRRAPDGHFSRSSGRKVWLWVLLAILGVAGVAGAVWFLMTHRPEQAALLTGLVHAACGMPAALRLAA